jgi:hypothetical protein
MAAWRHGGGAFSAGSSVDRSAPTWGACVAKTWWLPVSATVVRYRWLCHRRGNRFQSCAASVPARFEDRWPSWYAGIRHATAAIIEQQPASSDHKKLPPTAIWSRAPEFLGEDRQAASLSRSRYLGARLIMNGMASLARIHQCNSC